MDLERILELNMIKHIMKIKRTEGEDRRGGERGERAGGEEGQGAVEVEGRAGPCVSMCRLPPCAQLDGAAVRTLPEGAETQVRSPPQLRPWTSLLLLPLHTEVPIG
jgi:hypothetical protein